MHVEALGRGADLARVQERGPGAAPGGDSISSATSAQTMNGSLPPISRLTRATRSAQTAAIRLPVSTEPVNATHVDPLVGDDRGADVAGAGDHVDDAGRQVVEARGERPGSRAASAPRACRRSRCRPRAPARASRPAAAAGSSRARCSRPAPTGSLTTSASWLDSIDGITRPGRVAADLGVVVERGRGPADLVGVLDQRLAALERHQLRRARRCARAAAWRPRAAARRARPPGCAPSLAAPRRAAAIAASSCSADGALTVATVSSVYGFSTSSGPPVPGDPLAPDREPGLDLAHPYKAIEGFGAG